MVLLDQDVFESNLPHLFKENIVDVAFFFFIYYFFVKKDLCEQEIRVGDLFRTNRRGINCHLVIVKIITISLI